MIYDKKAIIQRELLYVLIVVVLIAVFVLPGTKKLNAATTAPSNYVGCLQNPDLDVDGDSVLTSKHLPENQRDKCPCDHDTKFSTITPSRYYTVLGSNECVAKALTGFPESMDEKGMIDEKTSQYELLLDRTGCRDVLTKSGDDSLYNKIVEVNRQKGNVCTMKYEVDENTKTWNFDSSRKVSDFKSAVKKAKVLTFDGSCALVLFSKDDKTKQFNSVCPTVTFDCNEQIKKACGES